jgi:hypothetical protein
MKTIIISRHLSNLLILPKEEKSFEERRQELTKNPHVSAPDYPSSSIQTDPPPNP